MTAGRHSLRFLLASAAYGVVLMVICTTAVAAEKLSVAWMFGDHMVLQLQADVPVFGKGVVGNKVTVSCNGTTTETVVGQDDKWLAKLPPMKAGGPYDLQISSGNETLTLKDVLFGDVWLCSGQSNMEWSVNRSNDAKSEIANANYPKIRLFQVKKSIAEENLEKSSGKWQICSPKTVGPFSGVAYFFGREIHTGKNVPIGLVQASWSGSPVESWMTAKDVSAICGSRYPYLKTKGWLAKAKQDLKDRTALWKKQTAGTGYHKDAGIAGCAEGWSGKDCEADKWQACQLPGTIEHVADKRMDGAVWFRRKVSLPADWQRQGLLLALGPVDDFDKVWFNGDLIGETGKETPEFWKTPRKYAIPGRLVKGGDNTIVIRVFDHGGAGGFNGFPEDMKLSRKDAPKSSQSLAGEWHYRIEQELQEKPTGLQYLASGLYNAMICPLASFQFKGVIWYQGEANQGRATTYAASLGAMIKAWREVLKQEQLPFLVVQLPNIGELRTLPGDSSRAELRNQQLKVYRDVPHVGLAITTDIGDPGNNHPKNKQDFGQRLALVANQIVYQDKTAGMGPTPESVKFTKDGVLIGFRNVGQGLKSREGKLSGFELAGENGVFVRANARANGSTVTVSHPNIPRPVAVRYAWADNPQNANLVNNAGLPASTFEYVKKGQDK